MPVDGGRWNSPTDKMYQTPYRAMAGAVVRSAPPVTSHRCPNDDEPDEDGPNA